MVNGITGVGLELHTTFVRGDRSSRLGTGSIRGQEGGTERTLQPVFLALGDVFRRLSRTDATRQP
jgi:hypothetical protein